MLAAVVGLAAVLLAVLTDDALEAVFLVVALVGSLVLNDMLKASSSDPGPASTGRRSRPETSFPSGHAMNSFVVYVAIALVIWRLRGRRAGSLALALAIVLSVSVGISRIYLGAHWLTDVIGAYLAGALWLLLLVAAWAVPHGCAEAGDRDAAPGDGEARPVPSRPAGDADGSGATTVRTLGRISKTTGVEPRSTASARTGTGRRLVMRTRLARSVRERRSCGR